MTPISILSIQTMKIHCGRLKIKKIIGWQKTKVDQKAIIENNVISGFNSAVEIKEKDSGALVISVTHNNAQKGFRIC